MASVLVCSEAHAGSASTEQTPVPEVNQERSYDDVRVDALVESIRKEMMANNMGRVPLLLLAAKQGNAKACNIVGWAFDQGVGVAKKDSAKALRWFESCAKKSALANYNAGVLYFEGRGTDKNEEKGSRYFRIAWAIGGPGFYGHVPQIPIRLAYFYGKRKSYSDEWYWAEKAASYNAKHGKYLVARMLVERAAPVTDDALALGYLNSSVDAFSAPSASLLAWCYGTGRFSERNYALAQEYDLIATKIDPRYRADTSTRWAGHISETVIGQAERASSNWFSTHTAPAPMDFVSTLIGTEDQFKR